MLTALLTTLQRAVTGRDITAYDQHYQLHLGHHYHPSAGDLVLTRRPNTDQVWALTLTADGRVAAINEVPDAAPDGIPTAAADAAAHITEYTSWPLDVTPLGS